MTRTAHTKRLTAKMAKRLAKRMHRRHSTFEWILSLGEVDWVRMTTRHIEWDTMRAA